jgi:hypothetical protein
MIRREFQVVALMLGALLLTGCGGSPFDVAATALAPTPLPPPGTPITPVAGQSIFLTPQAEMGGIIYRQNETHRYTFFGEAGQAVTINMVAPPEGALDSFLELLGPGGASLITNDDGGSSFNSRIDNFVLPETGEYTILAHGYGHTSTGGYTLDMDIGTPVPTPTITPTVPSGGGPIVIGDSKTGAITVSGQIDRWRLTGQVGELLTFDMIAGGSGNLDPYLEIIGPTGVVLRVDDDGGSGLNSRIVDFRLPQDGEYIIRAQGISTSTGDYVLTVNRGAPPTPTPPPPTYGPTPTPVDLNISLGEQVTHELRPNTGGDFYKLQIDHPAVVEILLQAEDERFNLYLDVEMPVSGRTTLVDYGSASTVVYLPSLYLRMQGQYIFRIRSVESRFINYTLQIMPIEEGRRSGGEIRYGQGVSGALQFPSQEDAWTFEGRAGDVVTIMMYGDGLDCSLELLNSSGNLISSDSAATWVANRDARIDSVQLPADGVYTIVASSFRSNSQGQYRLHLYREENE